jgi:hypothetical protein
VRKYVFCLPGTTHIVVVGLPQSTGCWGKCAYFARDSGVIH